MDEKTRKRVLFVGALFVALMFVFSYVGVSSNVPTGTHTLITTTTLPPQRTFFASGTANATIVGYAGTATLMPISNSTALANSIASTLSSLRNNGTIQNYVTDGPGYDLILGNINSYSLQQLLYSRFNATNSIRLSSTANARLNGRVNLFVGNQSAPVQINGTYQLNFTPLVPINSPVRVSVQALVTQNGIVYNNQVAVSYRR